MRQRLCSTDEFYQVAIGKLLELCTNRINEQRIIQLSGYLYLTVDNGDTFELIINEVEDVKLNDERVENTRAEEVSRMCYIIIIIIFIVVVS